MTGIALQSRIRTGDAAFRRQMPGHADRINSERAEHNEKSQKGNKRLAKFMLVGTLVLLAVSLFLYFMANYFGTNISRFGHSASTKPLEIVIGNSVLHIPENTIRFPAQRKSGAFNRIELYLHWPRLSGYQDNLKTAFSRTSDLSDLIFLSIEPRSMSIDMSGRIEPIYRRFFEGDAQSVSPGLIKQKLSREGGFIDEDLYFEASSTYPFAARCVRENSSVGNPLCMRDIHVGRDLMVTYRFHKKHLINWKVLDQSIRSYVDQRLMN
ncbi:MAG: hypothetical protein AAF217_14425 [Pseudomonadota bacterium]